MNERIKCADSFNPLIIEADITSNAERIISETINHFEEVGCLDQHCWLCNYMIQILKTFTWQSMIESIVQLSKLAGPQLKRRELAFPKRQAISSRNVPHAIWLRNGSEFN